MTCWLDILLKVSKFSFFQTLSEFLLVLGPLQLVFYNWFSIMIQSRCMCNWFGEYINSGLDYWNGGMVESRAHNSSVIMNSWWNGPCFILLLWSANKDKVLHEDIFVVNILHSTILSCPVIKALKLVMQIEPCNSLQQILQWPTSVLLYRPIGCCFQCKLEDPCYSWFKVIDCCWYIITKLQIKVAVY